MKDIEECKTRLEELGHQTGENIAQTNGKIAKCVDILIEMNRLIVVFDAIRCIDNLEDAIADALWNEISYRCENRKKVNDAYDPRAEELKWCLVSFSFSLRWINEECTRYFWSSFQIWNKEAHGELEILINYEDDNMALVETKRRWVSNISTFNKYSEWNSVHYQDQNDFFKSFAKKKIEKRSSRTFYSQCST